MSQSFFLLGVLKVDTYFFEKMGGWCERKEKTNKTKKKRMELYQEFYNGLI